MADNSTGSTVGQMAPQPMGGSTPWGQALQSPMSRQRRLPQGNMRQDNIRTVKDPRVPNSYSMDNHGGGIQQPSGAGGGVQQVAQALAQTGGTPQPGPVQNFGNSPAAQPGYDWRTTINNAFIAQGKPPMYSADQMAVPPPTWQDNYQKAFGTAPTPEDWATRRA